jgi:hypothetical protein
MCDTVSTDKDMGQVSDEHIPEDKPVPAFGEAVAGFEMVRQYLTSWKEPACSD